MTELPLETLADDIEEAIPHGPQVREGWGAFAVLGAVVMLGGYLSWQEMRRKRGEVGESRER